jgi:hypothetical protein
MDQLTNLLEQLAIKLGTTVEYLWEVLIKQAYINGILGMVYIVFTLLATIVLYRFHKYFSGPHEKYNNHTKYYDENAEEVSVSQVIMFTAALILLVMNLCMIVVIHATITAFMNPEYWALQKVLSFLN